MLAGHPGFLHFASAPASCCFELRGGGALPAQNPRLNRPCFIAVSRSLSKLTPGAGSVDPMSSSSGMQEMLMSSRNTEEVLMPSRNPEDVIMSRGGSVLGKKTVLKSDHFPGCQNKKILPHIDGAPNFRQISGMPVYGVAIPTVDGIRNVLHMVGASREPSSRPVLWHNMREEPVVYINGRPFVLREVERPFSNLEYTGIDRERVEAMEARLKEDILVEAARYSNKVMVSDELDNGQMVDMWEPIGPNSVQTPLEVYEVFQEEGYKVNYHRVPVTDEKSPKERDFDLLVSNLAVLDRSVAQVFNCQMGRGRTTTGTVVATLLALRRWPDPDKASGHPDLIPVPLSSSAAVGEKKEEEEQTEDALKRGEYAVIRSLVRVLERGAESKRVVDSVINRCSDMQNLREAILGYRNGIHVQADERKRQAALSNFVEYLERYYFLICFAAFLHDRSECLDIWVEAHAVNGASVPLRKDRFQEWMKARPELYSILRRLLRRDPMGALAYSRVKDRLRASAMLASGQESTEEMEKMLNVVRSRQGAVLGRQTMLKSDHCPGCQSQELQDRIEGAPNFRAIPGFNVFGVATPTVDGIRSVLERVGANKNGGGRRVVWHNMREEATVYVNGRPFVLREAQRPFKNMLEYTGIDCTRVEAMEARLKEDVLFEARRNQGAVVVTHETENGAVFHALERILPVTSVTVEQSGDAASLGSPSVHTPLEIFQGLQKEGFQVEYERQPITDGRAPKNRDLDAISARVGASDPDTAFVFNCQMGRGRTTTGTVLACLVLTRCLYGIPLRLPRQLSRCSTGSLEAETLLQGEARRRGEGVASLEATPSSRMDVDARRVAGGGGQEDVALSGPEGEEMREEKRMRMSGSSEAAVPDTDLFGLEDIAAVRRVTRLLPHGGPSRNVLDSVIDACAVMQNIREAVLRYRQIFNQQTESAKVRQGALNRGVEYVERYITLIAFTAYLNTPHFVPSGTAWPTQPVTGDAPAQPLTFKDWVKQRPEIRQIRISMRLRPSRVFGFPEDDFPKLKSKESGVEGDEDAIVMEAVVRSRSGSVLSRSSILKLYHFPGLKTHQNIRDSATGAVLDDVPNFFQVPGLPVCSMATPTADGARLAVQSLLGTAVISQRPSEEGSDEEEGTPLVPPRGELSACRTACEVKIMDLREEAVVYIRGQPYVLRDMEQPGGPLKHTGIEGPMVELMEQRLKEELLQEAQRMGGKVLLHREEEDEQEDLDGPEEVGTFHNSVPYDSINSPSSKLGRTNSNSNSKVNNTEKRSEASSSSIELLGFWSHVSLEDVQTPAEVYRRLHSEKEGMSVVYSRIPLTRQRVPQAADIDAIQRCMDGSKPCVKYLLVSHTGYGAIAYAMAITCLRLLSHARAPQVETSYLTACPHCQSHHPPHDAPLESTPGVPAATPNHSTRGKQEEAAAATSAAAGVAASITHSVDLDAFNSPLGQLPHDGHVLRRGPLIPDPVGNETAGGSSSSKGSQSRSGEGGSGGMKRSVSSVELGLSKGEYRSVLSLERLLVQGPACKTEVDLVADRLRPVGNIVGDILEYKQMMDAVQGDERTQLEQKAALKEMGIKALQRYCFLIIFRAYLLNQIAKKGHTTMEGDTFESWVAAQPEITHLFQHLSLN